MKTAYRGWIPTVTGRLSFSHFGDCKLRRSQSLSRADGISRILIVRQRRTIWDVMLPTWKPFERAVGLRGSAQFICVAKTFDVGADRQGVLRGHAYIISDMDRWKEKLRNPFDGAITRTAEPTGSARAQRILRTS